MEILSNNAVFLTGIQRASRNSLLEIELEKHQVTYSHRRGEAMGQLGRQAYAAGERKLMAATGVSRETSR